MRKYAREVSFCLVFQYLFSKERDNLSLDIFDAESLTPEDKTFIAETYNGTLENFDSLQEIVSNLAKGYKLERIYKVDLAVLLVAAYELYHTQIPTAIAVNEAVDIAKKFSTDNSVRFVNGILAQVAKGRESDGGNS